MAQLFSLRQFISQIFLYAISAGFLVCDTIIGMHDKDTSHSTLAFIGGGNMASAIIGGLIHQGTPASRIIVIEPFQETRQRIEHQFNIKTYASAGPALEEAGLVVWAVKPQVFKDAALSTGMFCKDALHLSVAAGIRSDSIAQWLNSERIVRAMPNTPALVGLGQTGLFARPSVTAEDKGWIERIVATTGQYLWVNDETLLDAVTAVSGSGPAYVFFFIEAMVKAGVHMGLTEAQAHQLAVGTFVGAAELARSANESPTILRERVTSKGGTTYAAISTMQAAGMAEQFQAALLAAQQRATEMGDAFGG
ncbi:ProC Pyrroline-5-carboxylate reductase [Burkholderiaceae bacterium]